MWPVSVAIVKANSTRGEGRTVGIVGGGQLARMMAEAAPELDIATVVLAETPNESATGVADRVIVGEATNLEDLFALAAGCDVITFDHEQVDLGHIRALLDAGHRVQPGLATLEVATNKVTMRERFAAAGLPVPAFTVVAADAAPRAVADAVAAMVDQVGLPLVIKPERGGYDGKGVFVEDTLDDAVARVTALSKLGRVLVEAHVDLAHELAVIVARSGAGEIAVYPPVETAQMDGMCREVIVPGSIDPVVADTAAAIARRVADLIDSAGVLAVEFFVDPSGDLTICEVAARPHNSGHWTIEGALTSQFANHLLGVLSQPLGSVDLTAANTAMVNVVGADDGRDPEALLTSLERSPTVVPHLYGKAARPGRKLGHVTATGDDAVAVRDLAWATTRALGGAMPSGGSLNAEEE